MIYSWRIPPEFLRSFFLSSLSEFSLPKQRMIVRDNPLLKSEEKVKQRWCASNVLDFGDKSLMITERSIALKLK